MTGSNEINRRDALKLGVLGATAAGLASQGLQPAEAQTPRADGSRPNILLIMVDEQRYPTAYESEQLRSFRKTYLPAQNSLTARGITFERHYIASVACVPSRTSLYTGHYPSLHGVANTDGAAKAANDPDMHWLSAGSVPTVGHYLRASGYRTFWKGKWHAHEADLLVPGTQTAITSYDENGLADPKKEQTYLEANVLGPYGFDGWIGPEPHGADPLRSGSSVPKGQQGRDPAISRQVSDLLGQLNADSDDTPWFMAASFTNPHDIALWGFYANLAARSQGLFDFSVPDHVPTELFDQEAFQKTRRDSLRTKPSCQASYRDAYSAFMQPSLVREDYLRLYYKLHEDVDRHIGEVTQTLSGTKFAGNTVIIFTSDHGSLLGAHGGLLQKWYMAYEEALRVPLTIVMPGNSAATSVSALTSHIDIAPTILGLAGVNIEKVNAEIASGFTDALPLVGRDLSPMLRGETAATALKEPIYFMTDDDPSRGLDQKNFIGLNYDSVSQPNHVETVIAEIDGEIWKYSRYFDHPQYWTHPGTPGEDGVRDTIKKPPRIESTDEGRSRRIFVQDIKVEPVDPEFEMYNVSADPMELENLAGVAQWANREAQLAALLAKQRKQKRLTPKSGPVPGTDKD